MISKAHILGKFLSAVRKSSFRMHILMNIHDYDFKNKPKVNINMLVLTIKVAIVRNLCIFKLKLS